MTGPTFGKQPARKSMRERKQRIAFGKVDISKGHFLLSHSKTPTDNWVPTCVLSDAYHVDNMLLSVLIHNIKDKPILEMTLKELHLYLFELKNKNNIDYLHTHIQSFSNAYGPIHFSYIREINKNNIFYFIETECKLMGIHNTCPVEIIQDKFVDIAINRLFETALDSVNQLDAAVYNQDLYSLHDLIFKGIPTANNFEIPDPLTLIDFSRKMAALSILDFANMLNYLKKIKLLKLKDVKGMLNLFYVNHKQYKELTV